jgi:hypothetical protein
LAFQAPETALDALKRHIPGLLDHERPGRIAVAPAARPLTGGDHIAASGKGRGGEHWADAIPARPRCLPSFWQAHPGAGENHNARRPVETGRDPSG